MAKKLNDQKKAKIIEILKKSANGFFTDEIITVSEVHEFQTNDMKKARYNITIKDDVDARMKTILSYEGSTLKWVERAYYSPIAMRVILNAQETYISLYNKEFGKGV